MSGKFNLTDLQLCQFLDLGYLVLEPSGIETSTHKLLFDAAQALHQRRRELSDPVASLEAISDNLHVSVPKLRDVLESDVLDGALESILGKQYYRYPHSFIHESGPHDQTFHKDSPLPWGSHGGVRSHLPNWAMAFYYPQITTIELGATEILPGTQYWTVDRENDGRSEGEDRLVVDCTPKQLREMAPEERDKHIYKPLPDLDRQVEPLRIEVPEGSLVLVHFDLFHRGTRRVSSDTRFMYKFWYTRTVEPQIQHPARTISYCAEDPRRQLSVKYAAAWLGLDVKSPEPLSACQGDGLDGDWLSRNLSAIENNLESVIEQLLSGCERQRRTAMYALVYAGKRAIEPALKLLESKHAAERSAGAFLLGEVSSLSHSSTALLLSQLIDDPNDDVRMTLINGLGRMVRRSVYEETQSSIASLVDALERVLEKSMAHQSRSGVTQSPVRQCVYLAFLNMVTTLRPYSTGQEHLRQIAAVINARITYETDRFAKATAIEVATRLAEGGVVAANEAIWQVLRTERWSVAS